LGAVARVHTSKDAAYRCEDAKQSVRSVEECADRYVAGAESQARQTRAAHSCIATRCAEAATAAYGVTAVLAVVAYNRRRLGVKAKAQRYAEELKRTF
jgi:hypothetical protein